MSIRLRMTHRMWADVQADLDRPHSLAHERVAFLATRPADDGCGGLLLLVHALHPVADEHYEDLAHTPVTISGRAFSAMLGLAYREPYGIFHIHRHEHRGAPRFSPLDLAEANRFVPDFAKVRARFPHGALVLSQDSIAGLVWRDGAPPQPITHFTVVGVPTREIRHVHG